MRIRGVIVVLLFLSSWLIQPLDFAWKPLWPSAVALAAVFLLNRTVTGLLLGTGAGLILLAEGNPVRAVTALFPEHLFPVFSSTWNLSVLAFTLLLGGFAAVIERGGGLQALTAQWLAGGKPSGKRVQWSACLLGLVCFFDGLANSMLVGKTIGPMAERAGVSKARLAYIVDSTSSAVACVAVISTWIAYQLSMIREGLSQANIEAPPFDLFLKSIPFNFYCWFTLMLLAVVISRDWSIGAMRRAEKTDRPDEPVGEAVCRTEAHPSWRVCLPAVLPLGVLIIGLLAGLYLSGSGGEYWPVTLERVSAAFGQADAAVVLVWVSVLACAAALFMNAGAIREQGGQPLRVFGRGIAHLFKPVLILIAAWLLSSVLKALNAHEVLTALLKGNVSVSLFPMLVFITGALISFTTGTSWGTMGILMPLVLPTALGLTDGTLSATIYATIAAVFSGAVFGDHCSPFSDTTIVSSISCGIEPMEHVRTQLPYALMAATAAVVLGFLPTGWGLHPLAALPAGFIVLAAGPWILRKRTKHET